MRSDKTEWLIGQEEVAVRPLPLYSDIVVDFLDQLSGVLRQKAGKERYADVLSLAFWCRRGNILRKKEAAAETDCRLGRGLLFHITPSNVPVNFAFSYFFGLLSGNANIVRVPSRDFPQIDLICEAVREVLEKPEYQELKQGTAFVRYGRDKELTDRLSAKADGRIIWGGDEAIRTIRQSPMKPKSVEIVFADRYSLGILDCEAVLRATEEECIQLARHFYNDTYLMDQNACSTPHLLLWMGQGQQEARRRFWRAVWQEAQRYDLAPIKAVDKYTDLCMAGMREDIRLEQVKSYETYGNLLYTLELARLPEDINILRGKFGMFYQYTLEQLSDLAPYIDQRVQTLVYYGIDRQELLEFVIKNRLLGIDRIVPFGSSLEMDVYWDGYDILGQLSRRLEAY